MFSPKKVGKDFSFLNVYLSAGSIQFNDKSLLVDECVRTNEALSSLFEDL